MRCPPLLVLLLLPSLAVAGTVGGPEAFRDGFGTHATALPPEAISLTSDRLRLDTPQGRLDLDVSSRRRHANGDLSVSAKGGAWRGLLTLGSAAVYGTLDGPGGRRLVTTDAGGTWLVDVPVSGISVNECGLSHPAPTKRRHRPESGTEAAPGTVIDLLLIYNTALANRYPGMQLPTRLNHLVHIANQTMGNSGLDVGFRLVGTEHFNVSNLTGNTQFRDDIAATLAGDTRPGLAGLAELRDSLGADLVIGLRPHDIDTRGSCGIAFFPEGNAVTGVNVVSDGASSWSFCLDDVLTHEIGHNLGATHQLGAGGGLVDPRGSAFVREGRFITMMGSFGTGRPDRLRGLAIFSGPLRPCGNEPCGNETDTDNATVIRAFAGEVAAYRSASSDLPEPEQLARADSDQDGDGVTDWFDALPFDASEQLDSDADGRGDNADAFPSLAEEQDDTDGDGIGDNADTDDDGDGVDDTNDAFPKDPRETADVDLDGIGDVADAFPGSALEWRDTDADGIGDNADTDDDGDGVPETDPTRQDLLVVSVDNRQILRFDAATGEARGVEVPAWDSRITFQTGLAWREADQTLVYGGDSGLRRLDLLQRRLLGEWVPPYDSDIAAPQLGSGFPMGLASLEGGRRVVTTLLQNPRLATFRGQERARLDPFVDWRLDPSEIPGDITGDEVTAYVTGLATRTIYTVSGLGVQFLAGPGVDWMGDPSRMAVGQNGRLLISDRARNAVIAVDIDDGEFLGEFARLGPVGFDRPEGIAVTNDGVLLVAAGKQNAILAFDAANGAFLDTRVSAGAGGLSNPGDMVLVPSLADRFATDPERQIRPNPGLWYDPASDGRGFDIQYYGTRLSVIWYTYDDQGDPTWYLAAGALDGATFQAPLLRFTLDDDGPANGAPVGDMLLDFASERRAAASWRINGVNGEESLSWLEFTPQVRQIDDTGLWGREDGPGWGVSLASQGGTTVAVAYLYDALGQPRWVISEPVTGNPPYRLNMQAAFAPGLCPGCVGAGERSLLDAGTMELRPRNKARWDSDIVLPGSLDGAWPLHATPVILFSLPSVRPR